MVGREERATKMVMMIQKSVDLEMEYETDAKPAMI